MNQQIQQQQQIQRNSIQQIMNNVFDDTASLTKNNNSQLSHKKAGSQLNKMVNDSTPRQNINMVSKIKHLQSNLQPRIGQI